MPVETTEDRDSMVADFGTNISGDASFKGIFDHQYVEIADIIGNKPVIGAAYEDVSDLAYGDSLEVEADDNNFLSVDTDYTVIRVEHDGTGWALVILEES